MWIALLLIILSLLYILSLDGRSRHSGWSDLQGWYYAHRGLHNEEMPENSLSAFQAARDAGYGVELDVHLLKDGQLAVFHDGQLERVTGLSGRVADLTVRDLANCHLMGTSETIPLFSDVLDLFAGKVPLIIELKTDDNNAPALCQAVCTQLNSYSGSFCLESFDPRCVLWLKKHHPEFIRGQLSENFFHTKSPLPRFVQWLLTAHHLNFLTRPDFIAYRFSDRRNPGTVLCRRLWKLHGVSWTLQTQEAFDQAIAEGWIPIFEGFLPQLPPDYPTVEKNL